MVLDLKSKQRFIPGSIVKQYLVRHCVSSDQHMKKLLSPAQRLHVVCVRRSQLEDEKQMPQLEKICCPELLQLTEVGPPEYCSRIVRLLLECPHEILPKVCLT